MLTTNLSLPVMADAETLWTLTLDAIDNPERYSNILSSRIIDTQGTDIRQRAVRALGWQYREKISISNEALMVEYVLIDHPKFKGTTVHQVVPAGDQSMINVALNWSEIGNENRFSVKDLHPLADIANELKKFAEQLKK